MYYPPPSRVTIISFIILCANLHTNQLPLMRLWGEAEEGRIEAEDDEYLICGRRYKECQSIN